MIHSSCASYHERSPITDTRILTARDLGVAWVKSSYSDAVNACVEVGGLPGTVAVRDSRNPDGPALLMPSAAFASFITGVREGRFES
ncbi:DUF397 domain-containing protein [Streptomyces sp. NPDC020898]|uniref:DUF397 domain-containing protein n=1 Tax=Streptomyces sp. NPDC020898 TaxID=3365101 RepID=UPI0037AD976E